MRQKGTVPGSLLFAVLLAVVAGGAAADETAARSSTAKEAPPDLRAPPITHVLTASEIETLTVDRSVEPPADVNVETARTTVHPPVGFFRALPWAIMHPTQAWRVLTPVTD